MASARFAFAADFFTGMKKIASFLPVADAAAGFVFCAKRMLVAVFCAERIAVCFTAALALFAVGPASAQSPPEPLQRNEAETKIFELLNDERTAHDLPKLRWDDALFKAAREHALRMLDLNLLEHQLPGEPSLQERLTNAGARFTFIAENIGLGKDPSIIHTGWMMSPGHRENILNPRATNVGIAVVHGTGGLFAVEDFAEAFKDLTREEQEKQVKALLKADGLRVENSPEDARRACDSDAGVPGIHEWTIVRFEAGGLSTLPPEVQEKIHKGQYSSVVVGACHTSEAAGFGRYKIALIFY